MAKDQLSERKPLEMIQFRAEGVTSDHLKKSAESRRSNID